MNAVTASAPASVVNGLNLDDLTALIAAVQADPAQGQTQWRVTTAWQGRTHSRSRIEGFGLAGEEITRAYSVDIDEPRELGGTDLYANPQEHLLTALNACMSVGFAALCALNGIALECLEITTEGEIDLRGFLGLDAAVPPGYPGLRATVRIKGSATEAEFRRIFEAVLATSPNVHNITRPVRLAAELVVG